MLDSPRPLKPVDWVGTARSDLRALPAVVQRLFGQAILIAQQGGKAADAKPLKGFGGAAVLEIVCSHQGNAFRVVYTTRFPDSICILHVFQKKSRSGIKTSLADIRTIKRRLREVEDARGRST
jgi:phage-related protein